MGVLTSELTEIVSITDDDKLVITQHTDYFDDGLKVGEQDTNKVYSSGDDITGESPKAQDIAAAVWP